MERRGIPRSNRESQGITNDYVFFLDREKYNFYKYLINIFLELKYKLNNKKEIRA